MANLTNLKANAFTDVVSTIVNTTNIIPTTPKVTSITYPGDDTAANTGGGQTVTLTGTGFSAGASILINAVYAGVVTVVSNTTITFTAPAQNAGTYTLYVINSDGGTAISIPGISYSGTPTWTTAAGSLGTSYETAAISNSLTATGDATISYSLLSGTLPPGSSLNSSTGLLSGTSQGVESSTTYNFTIRVTDGQNQETDRAFSITINPDVVTWSSPEDNSITTAYEYAPISNVTMNAASVAGKSITYTANALPTGVTITGNTISGTPTVVANTFTQLTANAANTFKTATKNISFVVNPDVVTWNSPADGTSTALIENILMANVTLSATSAAGKSITYTANALPTGVSISGANVSGTPTVTGTTNSLITATAATTNRTATRNFTWIVSLGNEIYFKNTTLLLNGETTVTPFISDASTNSFGLTINGDTEPVTFNPYTPGYYSNYFDGTGDYLYTSASSANAMGTGDYTVESWIYVTAAFGTTGSGRGAIISNRGQESAGAAFMLQHYNGKIYFGTSGTDVIVGSTTMVTNTWYHVVVSRSSGTVRLFLNGVSDATAVTGNSTNHSDTNAFYVGRDGAYGAYSFTGYISNARLVKGTAVYTSAFTPPTTPLTAISGTTLLTCQSNRLIDNSTNAFTITKNGDTLVSPNTPFTQNASYSTYGSTYFDGTGDTLSIPSPTTGFSLGTGEFTIECWVYKPSALNTVLLDARSSAAGLPWAFVINDTNFPYWYDNTTYTSTVAVTLNSWNHVAVVRTSGVLKIFVNGVQGYSASYGTNLDRTSGLIIGDTVHAAAPLLGYISDLRIVKGTAVYTSAFTPPTAPLTAIANTQLLTLQYNGNVNNSNFIDNSNFNNTITKNGNATQGSFSPYSVTGWSNYFDGTGDNLLVNYNSALHLSADFTIECWFYANVHGGMILNFAGGLNIAWASYELVTNADGINFAGSSTNNGYDIGSESGATGRIGTIQLGTWNHLAVTRSGNIYRGFVNGVQGYTQTLALTPYDPNARGFAIGGNYATTWGSGTPTSVVNGYISNLRIVKGTALYTTTFTPSTTPLTPITNTSLLTCQSNRLIDNSPNSFTITKNGDVSVQAFDPFSSVPEAVPISYSNYFDGTGDYLSAGSNSSFAVGTGDFTFQVWVYPTAYTSPVSAIFDTGSAVASGRFSVVLYSSGLVYVDSNANLLISSSTLPLNAWTLISIIRSSGTMTMYFNGTSVASGSIATNFTETQSYIGRTVDGYYFQGYISNLRLVKGTALANTVPTTPLTAITNTSLLTCQSTTMIDNSTNAFTLTATGDVKPRIFNPFGYTEQTYTSYTPSLHGGSAYFDGTGDYLTAPASTLWNFTGDWTWECWVYPTAITGYHTFLGQWGNPDNIFIWKMNSSGRMYLENLGAAITATSTTIVANQWQHIALTRSSNTIRMFVNGVLDATTASRSGTYYSSGAMYVGTGYGEYFTGYMSDLRITKSALYTSNFVPPTQTLTNYSTNIPAQLLLNFNNGGIIDQHGTNVLETVGNAQLSTAVKKYGSASMRFDGTGDYLKIPNSQNFNFGSGNFTVEGWVYCTNTSSRQDIFTTPANASGFNGLSFAIYNGNFELTMSWTGGWDILFATAGSVSVNTWYHFAVVRNGGTVTVYINGTSTYSNSGLSTSSLVFGTDPATISYGRVNQSDARYLYGYIDDFRITKGYARYTGNFTAPTSTFVTK